MTAPADRPEVSDPTAYRARILGLVAGREPLDVLAATPRELVRIFAATPLEKARRSPGPGAWSPVEILGHMTDSEWAFGYRTRTILCDDAPVIVPMDQERWVATLRHAEREPAELLDAFESLRRLNLAAWRRIEPRQLERTGRHAERGVESLGLLLRLAAGHDRNHLAQIERTLGASR